MDGDEMQLFFCSEDFDYSYLPGFYRSMGGKFNIHTGWRLSGDSTNTWGLAARLNI